MILNKKFDEQKTIPLVLGSSVNAYGIVRSFAKKGILSLVISYDNGLALRSKYVQAIHLDKNNESDESLLELFSTLSREFNKKNKKAVIFCTSDKYLIFIGKNKNRISSSFIIPMSDSEIIENCIDKQKLYKRAKEIGISCPKTYSIEKIQDINNFRDIIPYPIIIKPTITVGFTEKLGLRKKAVIVNNENELKLLIMQINKKGLDQIPLIIQEVIPGDQTKLFTISAYTDKNADILAFSIGHKIRQSPPDAGTITAGFVEYNEDVFKLGKKILKEIGLHGISNTEFKYDRRDDKFKLIEINPRSGTWNYSATASGINLPYECYLDIIGLRDKRMISTNKNVTWYLDVSDMINSVYRNKNRGYLESNMSFRQWYRSVKNNPVKAIWNYKDPQPYIHHLLNILSYGIKSKCKKLRS